MRGLIPPKQNERILSRRAREELGALQAAVHELTGHRNAALRIFMASRYATTVIAQRDFWLEFAWIDQEYRLAVRRLREFCLEHGGRSVLAGPPPPAATSGI